MPAKSKAQQRLMGLAYGNPEIRKQIGIKKKDARKLASTKHAGLPEKVNEMMDPLQSLWDLYEDMNLVTKPSLEPPVSATIGSPTTGDYNHPEIQKKKDLDDAREQGMTPEQASEYVSGEVQTDNSDSKAQFAADLGRFQQNDAKVGVRIDKIPLSLLAQDETAKRNNEVVSPMDLKTPAHKEVPDAIQGAVSKPVDNQEEYDYNLDVAFLQKYGRA